MSIADLTNTCPACGAEESLDALLMRMIDDDDVRRLISEVLMRSLPLGGQVVRYLRLHKPAKQRLRMSRMSELLAELVPDITRAAIYRKGRDWAVPVETWKLGLEAVFEAIDKGSLKAPLQGNGYLYEVLLRMADRHEAEAERQAQEAQRHRTAPAVEAAPRAAADALAPRTAAPPPPPPGPSAYARRMQAQLAALRAGKTQPADNEEGTK